MTSNRGVAYIKRGEVQVQSIDFPSLVDASNGRKIEHGEITAEVIEGGRDVLFIREGGIVSEPSNPGFSGWPASEGRSCAVTPVAASLRGVEPASDTA
jgi:hypothetical protein